MATEETRSSVFSNGTLIQTIDIPGLATDFYGFSRDLGVQDIAGVSIYNNDGGGIGLDNLIHDVESISTVGTPEPASMLLIGGGLPGLGLIRRLRC